MRKCKTRKGETITETLVAVLIMSLAFLMMAGAVAAAARINARIKNQETAFALIDSTDDSQSATINGMEVPIVIHTKADGGYYYYEYNNG